MSLEQLIECAGGINNIRRILAPQGRVTLSVFDDQLVHALTDSIIADWVVGEYQLSMERGDITDAELHQVGLSIAEQQRIAAQPHLQPAPCHFRPQWHISPPQGLLNDPNGFVYHQGAYHLFYQWYPYDCVHKDKYWVHLKSADLMNWHHQSIALTPSDWFDSNGVFSGHAVSQDDGLWLFYTGNTRLGEERWRQTMQCAAHSVDGKTFTKLGPLIREVPDGVTEHIRDPKVVYQHGKWWMILGAQTTDLQGRLAIYHSDNLRDWTFDRLCGDELAPFGYMWECPDWFELDGEQFVVFGPQGIKDANPHHTIGHQNRIFRVNSATDGNIHFNEGWQLDGGFDFYAPQSLLTPDGRRVMVGWMGLPDELDQPTRDFGWLHQLTTMRELHWQDGAIRQYPAREINALLGDAQSVNLDAKGWNAQHKSYQLTLSLAAGAELQLMSDEQYHVSLVYDADKRVLRFDRSATLIRESDVIRELPISGESVELTILADNSSLEVFINNGEKVMTGRVFTPQQATEIRLLGQTAQADFRVINAAFATYPLAGESQQ